VSGENWQFFKYMDKNGNDPVWNFLEKQITRAEQRQVESRMKTVIELGMNAVNGDIVEHLGENLYVLRMPNTPNNPRIFMCTLSKFRPKSFVMLHAYRKKSEKIPESEMRIARKRLKEVQDNPNQHVF